METPVARTGPQLALMESQNIIQDEQVGGRTESAPTAPALSSCASVPPLVSEASIPRVEAETPTPTTSIVTVDEKLKGTGHPGEAQEAVKAESEDVAESVSTPTELSTNQPSEIAPEDSEAASLALARQLLEEEAMASYATAVDMLRAGGGDDVSSGGGGEGSLASIEGVSSEDMAAMRALMEEDEMASGAVVMAEHESLDYDDMLELGSAIGDVRQERWRLRCHEVINQLPLLKYVPGGMAGEDSKCLVCQCDFEEGEELRKLPCKHMFHAECVDSWLEQSEECPTCRRSVSQG